MSFLYEISNSTVAEWCVTYRGPKFHALLSDPPYEIGFMNHSFDATGVSFQAETWSALKQHLLPGAFMFIFGGSRTFHRLMCSIEDAGLVIHPTIAWVRGNGFPKATRVKNGGETWNGHRYGLQALKPAAEFIICAQNPYDGSTAENIIQYGSGALNIEVSKIPIDRKFDASQLRIMHQSVRAEDGYGLHSKSAHSKPVLREDGRWPSNLIHDGSEEVVALFPQSAGQLAPARTDNTEQGNSVYSSMRWASDTPEPRRDAGSAARFFMACPVSKECDPLFYSGKASRSERDAGLAKKENPHPTVKPISLTTYLAKLLSPPPEYAPRRILVPFSGVGSEIIGALKSGGFDEATGVDFNSKYCDIAKRRIEHFKKMDRRYLNFP